MNTVEGNKMIAEFMGLEYFINHEGNRFVFKTGYMPYTKPRYNTSWDWLMPVVEKINTLAIDNFGEPCFVIHPTQCFITDGYKDMKFNSYVELSGGLLINAAYNTVVSFLQWYNQNKK